MMAIPTSPLKPHARTMLAQASACGSKSAGIRPEFGPFGQPGGYGIVLDITPHALELPRMPNPVVERLILPERLPGSVQQKIRPSGGLPFNQSCNDRQFVPGAYKQVNVIRHRNERMKFIPVAVPITQFGDYLFRDIAHLQPTRPLGRRVQQPVARHKRPAIFFSGFKDWQRSRQPPRHEYRCSRRVPVREIAPIHSLTKWDDSENFPALTKKSHPLKPAPPSCVLERLTR